MATSEVEEISEEEIETAAESDDVVSEFLNAGVPEGIDDEETPGQTEEVTDGPARDEQGRFVKKAEGEETPAVEAATDAPVATDAPPPEPEVPAQPFSFKVSGKDYMIDGAEYRPGKGLSIPDQHVQTVRQLIGEGAYYKQNWKTLETTAEQRGFERALKEAPEVQQAQALSKVISELFENPEALAQAYENWATMGPMYREKAMREMAERQLEALKKGDSSRVEAEQSQQLEQAKETALGETMSTLRNVPDLKILTQEDWHMMDKQIGILKARGGLFVEKDGELYLDEPAIEEIALHILTVRKQVVDAAKKAEEAAKFNQANKPKAQAKVPVTTPRKGSAPKPTTESKKDDPRDIVAKYLKGELDDEDSD